jgi:glycyl-tRNA synthetase alpha subunit
MRLFAERAFWLAGVDIKAHDVRFVEDNWESPVWMMHTYPWLSSSFMLGFPHFDYWVAAR